MLTFTTDQPWYYVCLPEEMDFVYGSYYQTGTARHEGVFALAYISVDGDGNTVDRLSIDCGLALTANLHVGYSKY